MMRSLCDSGSDGRLAMRKSERPSWGIIRSLRLPETLCRFYFIAQRCVPFTLPLGRWQRQKHDGWCRLWILSIVVKNDPAVCCLCSIFFGSDLHTLVGWGCRLACAFGVTGWTIKTSGARSWCLDACYEEMMHLTEKQTLSQWERYA